MLPARPSQTGRRIHRYRSPYKTAVCETSLENGSKVTHITNRRAGQEPHFIERREEGNKVTIVKGRERERIVRTIERNALTDSKWGALKPSRASTRRPPPVPDSEEVYRRRLADHQPDGGSKTPLARTTLYTYNDQFRMALELKPNGGYTRYEYDEQGRSSAAEPLPGPEAVKEHARLTPTCAGDFRPATETDNHCRGQDGNGASQTLTPERQPAGEPHHGHGNRAGKRPGSYECRRDLGKRSRISLRPGQAKDEPEY